MSKVRTVLKSAGQINLALTLDCGQAFRWENIDGIFHGVAFGEAVDVQQISGDEICIISDEGFSADVWSVYFDLQRDYDALCEQFSQDETLSLAVKSCPGIRILHQDAWEALCSFILSQNNNIKRIKGIIDRLCRNFGEQINEKDYSFPSAQTLSSLSVDDLDVIRSGFRAKYVIDAARKVAGGEINLEEIKKMSIESAVDELKKIYGVGDKVAMCALLYGFAKLDAVPQDVWVKRIIEDFYPNGFPECTAGVRGIAQQYLFHWRRTCF